MMTRRLVYFLFLSQLTLLACSTSEKDNPRVSIDLNENWVTIADTDSSFFPDFQNPEFDTENWTSVNVPHNWDRYEGYRRLKHGNFHGSAWYRKTFSLAGGFDSNKRFFLFFEGVGSYATIYLNGVKVGEHAGGRTTFTLDVTDVIDRVGENILAVQADHPAHIEDLPWVCGGCSDEVGFSEGSQPLGVFRPVQLVVTNDVRIEPFGVHAWNDTTVSEKGADIFVTAELKNYGSEDKKIYLIHRLLDDEGKEILNTSKELKLASGQKKELQPETLTFENVQLWSPENPYLYELVTEVYENDLLIDQVVTPYGVRWTKWDIAEGGTNQFYLNGKPLFINGTAEYEHNLGKSHAFDDKMIKARVSQIRAAGFNAFRDAHQPHNFRYHHAWDSLGMLWWTQMAAHIWYDTPEFRENFKTLLTDWVKERRNSPSIILWGLENESTLPEEFARECTELIRSLDPGASTQRLVTTCNGGTGTDWDVPQNWTGTYGGNPDLYHEDVERQQLIGEYGAWRTLDFHEKPKFITEKAYTERAMTLLMEKKVWLADSAKEKTCGHFQWIFTSHENPGRNQSGEGFRELDRVGPVNYKGLLSPWGEPADVFYMYRANHVDPETEPMVYIESHTWPNRWVEAGIKDGIKVFSNCEEVELFCGNQTLGRKKHPGFGKHFQWDQVTIDKNFLWAVGYQNGERVAEDFIRLHHMPGSEKLMELTQNDVELSNDGDRNYLYRVNCGGPDYTDSNGNLWMADAAWQNDETWGSKSWTNYFDDLPPFYASQRRTFDQVFNTLDGELFQTFRYGQDQLEFVFPVEPGAYEIELHFIEPWYGTGGGMDCIDWRVFDVAVNGETVLNDLDIWTEAGHDQALIKKIEVEVNSNELKIHFPEVKSGQAIVSAIAISSRDQKAKSALSAEKILMSSNLKTHTWLDWGNEVSKGQSFQYLPSVLMGAEWAVIDQKLSAKETVLDLSRKSSVYAALAEGEAIPQWLTSFDSTKQKIIIAGNETITYKVFNKRFEEAGFLKVNLENSKNEVPLIVMATEAAVLKPAFDLKPLVPYNEDVVILKTKGFIIEKKFGFGCATVTHSGIQSLAWPISTGVGDYHAIHFKYTNETGVEKMATYSLIAADGTVMETAELNFKPTPQGKYRQISTFTQSMINAGSYQVQLTTSDAKGLSFRGIRVQ